MPALHRPSSARRPEKAGYPSSGRLFHGPSGRAAPFTICDRYHCSVLGPTNPNRLYVWTGTIDPGGHHGGPVINNAETPPYTWTTYPERLEAAGVSWRIYQQADNYDDNPLAWFRQYQQAPQSSSLYRNGLATRPAEAFAEDVRAGNLPQVSWIITPAAESEHPSYLPAAGAVAISRTLEALAAARNVWQSTVVLLTYDENDGFFDHVLPPTAPLGTPDEFVGGLPIGPGIRVPMLVISPWSQGGWVASEQFDHTSILQFLERRFGVEEPNISEWRRRTCGDLTSAFDFAHPSASFPSLPATSGYLLDQYVTSNDLPAPTVPAAQSMPHQESGSRPHRPVPPVTGHRSGRVSESVVSTG
ncbi:MAG: alkaline phosphatase family protein [Actinomycetes bacterium]